PASSHQVNRHPRVRRPRPPPRQTPSPADLRALALLAPLLPKPLDQLICLLLTDLLQVLGEILAVIPHGYRRCRSPTQVTPERLINCLVAILNSANKACRIRRRIAPPDDRIVLCLFHRLYHPSFR